MIVPDITYSDRIEMLHPMFKRLFDDVKSNDLLNVGLGRITLKGDHLYINNVQPTCVSEHKQKLEAHLWQGKIRKPIAKVKLQPNIK